MIAYFVVILITIMFLVLFVEFWLSLKRGLVLEQKKIVESEKVHEETGAENIPTLSIHPPAVAANIFQSQEDVETSVENPSHITSSYHYLIKSYRERNAPIPSAITSMFPEDFAVENPLRMNLKRFASEKNKASMKNVINNSGIQTSSRKLSPLSPEGRKSSDPVAPSPTFTENTDVQTLDSTISAPSTPVQKIKRVDSHGFDDSGSSSFRIRDKFRSAKSTRFPSRSTEQSVESGESQDGTSTPLSPSSPQPKSVVDFYKPTMTRKK